MNIGANSKSFLTASVHSRLADKAALYFKPSSRLYSRSYSTTEAATDVSTDTLKNTSSSSALPPSQANSSPSARSHFRNRVVDDEIDSEAFGLDQFAARIHLGKPAGSVHDKVLEPLRIALLSASQTRDASTAKSILDTMLAEHPTVFQKIESSGRLLWLILRAHSAQHSSLNSTFECRLWAATHLVDHLAHGNRAGYLWGVLLDALNRSDLVDASEHVWLRIEGLIKGPRSAEFVQDEQFLLVARLAGCIDSFNFDSVPDILKRLNACAGPDITAWAFTRCLGKYVMVHQQQIAVLPRWKGKDLSEIVPMRAAHLAPLLADAGCVTKAREYWIRDHTSLYANSSEATPVDLAEARLEMEHLRAGLLVFARYPVLEAPHDEILRVILNRFELVLKAHPSLCSHNHGLLYFLARSDFYALTSRLAYLFMRLGSSKTIVSTAMCSMAIRLGDFSQWRKWVGIRGEADKHSFLVVDRYAWWLFKAVSSPMPDILSFRLPSGFKAPMQYIAFADRLVRLRIAEGMKQTIQTESKSSETPIEGEIAAEDLKPRKQNSKFVDPAYEDVTKPYQAPTQKPINTEEYYSWTKHLERMAQKGGIGKDDLHSFHRIMLSLTTSGCFEDAENLILSKYRQLPPKQDVGVSFLLGFYAEMGLFDRLFSFTERLRKRFPERSIDTIVGETKLVELLHGISSAGASPNLVLDLYHVCNTPSITAYILGPLAKAVVATGDVATAEEIVRVLCARRNYHRVRFSIQPAFLLKDFLQGQQRYNPARKLEEWAKNLKSKGNQTTSQKIDSEEQARL